MIETLKNYLYTVTLNLITFCTVSVYHPYKFETCYNRTDHA